MRTSLQLLFGFLFLLGNSLFPRAEPVEANAFIREKGTYQFSAAGSSVEVITALDGKPSLIIDFKTKSKNSTGSNMVSFDKEGILRGDGWFVFVESENKLWIFDGKKSLAIAEYTKNSMRIKDFDAESAALCPKAVKDALPQPVRDTLFERHLF